METANKQPIRKGKGERYKLTTADGKSVYRAIKPLYRRAFGKEYSLDLIEDLDGEEWKPRGITTIFMNALGARK